ncbi:MAG: PQQ-binding-like beta-propeller repeat protein, partial [Planctomycetota bacterium]|nr:PQQ-binding-like beta-propeller repeat protein [Planctomycetota bacterium]
ALNLKDGNLLWQLNLIEILGGEIADYGMTSSPLVVGGRVIVTVGAPSATVAALDVKTGEIAWTAGEGHPAGYSSAAVRKVGGREQIVVFHGNGAFGLDPKTGAEHYVTDFNCNIATPIAVDDGVLLSAGENHGSVLLGLTPKGDGFDVAPRWSSLGSKSTLRNEWQTSVQVGDALFGFDNVGSAGPVTHLCCVNPKTGERNWQELRFGKGNLIAADGKLFIVTMQGELVVVKADPRKFTVLGRKAVVEKTRQAPALADGRLFIRDDKDIVCIDVRQK